MPWVTTIRVASWVFAMLVGLAVLYFGMVMGDFVPWLSLPLTAAGAAFAAFSAWRLWGVLRARKADEPVVVLSQEGYHDARLGRPIPWCEIERMEHDQPGTRTFLRLTVREAQRYAPRRLARNGVLVSSLSELSVPAEVIVTLAEAHRAAG